jgi:shikimate kinase
VKFIFLLGPKHSGKTTVGRKLATLLSCGFIDLDDYITEQGGKTPRALYMEGPEVFREAEVGALVALFNSGAEKLSPLTVVASGGGIIDNPKALALLEKNAAVMPVFLDVSVQTAWNRISREGELPPFLRTHKPQETHRLLHERRTAAYRQFAVMVIETDNKNPEKIAGEIQKKAFEFLQNLL